VSRGSKLEAIYLLRSRHKGGQILDKRDDAGTTWKETTPPDEQHSTEVYLAVDPPHLAQMKLAEAVTLLPSDFSTLASEPLNAQLTAKSKITHSFNCASWHALC
jgi:hypothetical protein